MTGSRMLTYAQALNEALAQELARDDRVVLFGEDVGAFGGVFGVSRGLQERFGAARVFDTPLSETLIVGAAVGAAMTGLRPVAELQYADFVSIAMDELYNKAARWRFTHGSQHTVPMVVRAPEGARGGGGPEHSQSVGGMLASAIGLHVVMPSSPGDAKGLLTAAIRSDDPVLFLEHKALYAKRGEVPEGEHVVPLGVANVVRSGGDVTVVAFGSMVSRAVQAAETVAAEGIEVEVVDPRGVRPLDMAAILGSVERTGRLVVVHEAPAHGGPGAEVVAVVSEQALDVLQAPIRRVTMPDAIPPQSVHLERMLVPGAGHVADAIREVCGWAW